MGPTPLLCALVDQLPSLSDHAASQAGTCVRVPRAAGHSMSPQPLRAAVSWESGESWGDPDAVLWFPDVENPVNMLPPPPRNED